MKKLLIFIGCVLVLGGVLYRQPLMRVFGALPVTYPINGGTGVAGTFANGVVMTAGGTSAFTGSSSPTILSLTATSTTATSTFGYGVNVTGGCLSIRGNCLSTLTLASLSGTSPISYNSGTGAFSFAYSAGQNMLAALSSTGTFVSTSTPTFGTFYGTSTTATSSLANGLDLSGGCLSYRGTCISFGGTVTGSGSAGLSTVWTSGSVLAASSSPLFGWLNATSTTATSTISGGWVFSTTTIPTLSFGQNYIEHKYPAGQKAYQETWSGINAGEYFMTWWDRAGIQRANISFDNTNTFYDFYPSSGQTTEFGSGATGNYIVANGPSSQQIYLRANGMTIFNTGVSNNFGFGTTTCPNKICISKGVSATTTITIGELGDTTTKGCVNMNQANGAAGSFYLAGGVMKVENNYCK